MSLDEAAAFYQQHARMSEAAARAEAVKNSLFPGAACMYLLGWDAIRRLQQEMVGVRGWSLRKFHDRLLALGSVPVSLAASVMREKGDLAYASA
jgi:uncharacterized protein (DUF885 family)